MFIYALHIYIYIFILIGLEEKFYKSDADCLAAGKHLPDLDLYISTVLPLENKGIRYIHVNT